MIEEIAWFTGFVGGLILAVSYIPQVVRMWERRREPYEDISPVWLILMLIGGIFYLMYGVFLMQPGMIVLNIVALFSCIMMLWLYKRNRYE